MIRVLFLGFVVGFYLFIMGWGVYQMLTLPRDHEAWEIYADSVREEPDDWWRW